MKLVLKGFQETALVDLARYARSAAREAAEGDAQALILAAPTGSGKTVIANALFERIMEGDEAHPEGDPKASFLWLTDQPELNEQTKRKFLANSTVFGKEQLITVDATFNEPRFAPGRVYFLNTQKVGAGTQLTKTGDKRTQTIWDTIRRTVEESPGSFWLCIDEAHRGMQDADPHFAATIVQRFIVGNAEIPPVPLVLGISATPQRFQEMLAGTARHQRPYVIPPEDVRESGLIKDLITVHHPLEKQPSDWTLLRAAAGQLNHYRDGWTTYSKQEKKAPVEPLLVVQVLDAPTTGKAVSRTDLGEALRELEDVLGPLQPHEVAHSMQQGETLTFGDRTIRYVAPPDIQGSAGLRVVFFKMALNTGWDCPRAEVMMSFRSAADYTAIAQLVGRMVRTPLAQRVLTDETLNTVALYLPYYDEDALNQVIGYLESADQQNALASKVRKAEDLVEVSRDPKHAKVFEFAQTLPSYVVEKVAKASNIRRLIRLSRYLAQDKVDAGAYATQRAHVVSLLEKERKRVKGTKTFHAAVAEAGQISVRVVDVAYAGEVANGGGDPAGNGATTTALTVAQQNVEDIYDTAGRQLGEGLHADYVKARVEADKSLTLSQAKVELYALLADDRTLAAVEDACGKRFTQLHTKHQTKINALADSRQQVYRKLLKMAKQPQQTTMTLPQRLLVDGKEKNWPDHLYVDGNGEYPAKLNPWEAEVLTDALKPKAAVAWLRNIPRQEWSFTVPYAHHSEDKPHYPDFLVFRRSGSGFVADILEPHSLSFDDGYAKAKGLAEYAKQHGNLFGRIELIGKIKGKMRRLNLNDQTVRDKVLVVSNNEQLAQLFEA